MFRRCHFVDCKVDKGRTLAVFPHLNGGASKWRLHDGKGKGPFDQGRVLVLDIVCFWHYKIAATFARALAESWKTWNVMELYNFIFQVWKVINWNRGSWQVMELQYIF